MDNLHAGQLAMSLVLKDGNDLWLFPVPLLYISLKRKKFSTIGGLSERLYNDKNLVTVDSIQWWSPDESLI